MTAEIAIFNKSAIALAADSAVTIEVENIRGDDKEKTAKIYNTVNKLFTLSKHRPVGIMVYGSADFMGVPWESIIKIFRQGIGDKKFNRLEEYATLFISFLDKKNALIPQAEQKRYFGVSTLGYFERIKRDILRGIEKEIKVKGNIATSGINKVIRETISKHHSLWKKADQIATIPSSHARKIRARYGPDINKIRSQVFQKMYLGKRSINQLIEIASQLFCKAIYEPGTVSGIVVAGFGEKETFPSIVAYQLEGVLENRMKYHQLKNRSGSVDFNTVAMIIPFAQDEMVWEFIFGVHPDYRAFTDEYLKTFADKYPETVLDVVLGKQNPKKDLFLKKLRKAGREGLEDLRKQVRNYEQMFHVQPIMRAVSVLPKEELAAMAESLVNLTVLRKKMSLDSETVGGPVDVAVISKGDGFVWIKRKHYFNSDLNPQFVRRYYD